ncbi:MAG: DUF3606 domain-containing protein [Bacteroidota bacterium]|nr:DUF3606 domain-containing protein [Bacteroidota bacterium]
MSELSAMQPLSNIKETKINLNNKEAIKEWSVRLNCEEKDLIHAIMVIGNSIQMVDDFLILNRKKKTDHNS